MRIGNAWDWAGGILLAGLATYSLSVCAAPPAPQSVAVATPLTYFGLHIHQADEGTPWPQVHFGSWRLWDSHVAWLQLENARGKWNFKRLDTYVALAETHKVEVLLPLGLTPRWASARPNEKSSYSPGNAAEPMNIDDWRNYVRTVAERYRGRVHDYEIWNEVNIPGFFSGSPETLVALTCAAYHILKSVDPANRLVGPSVTGVGKHLDWHRNFLAKGGGDCVDAIAHHFYEPASAPEAMVRDIRAVKAVMNDYGVGRLPLWNTETGWRIENTDGTQSAVGVNDAWRRVGATESAAFVARALILARSEGVERFFWYSWDHPAMGLIEPGKKTEKPGALAYGSTARWLTNMKLYTCQDGGGLWQCNLLKQDGKAAWIVWSESGDRLWRVPTGFKRCYVEPAGGKRMATDVIGGQMLVTQMPVFIDPI